MDNKMYELLNDEKLSGKLMQSETFKKEAREALKNEIPNVSDEQLATIIRCIQKGLKADSDTTIDQELEKVSGGISKKQILGIVADAVPVLTTAVGAVGGSVGGILKSGSMLNEMNNKFEKDSWGSGDVGNNADECDNTKVFGTIIGSSGVGAIGGLGLGIAIRAGIKKLAK